MKTIHSAELDQAALAGFEKEISDNFTYQEALTKKLDKLEGDFDENMINEIVLWKVNRAPFLKPETLSLLNKIEKGDGAIDKQLTKDILAQLLAAPGFDLPMTSTLLRFKNPQAYQIIDQRVYRFIYPDKTLKLTASIEKKIDLYLKYLEDLKQICAEKGLEFSKIDRTLYAADKELNSEIPLKGYGSSSKKSIKIPVS
jgi:thermostable 8-oxoguanine DNA glycosylase